MRRPAQLLAFNRSRLRAILFGFACATVLFLFASATHAQRGGGRAGRAGGRPAGGMRSRPLVGAPRLRSPIELPGGYSHAPYGYETPLALGRRSRPPLQFRRGYYLGYGFWPLYGWAPYWADDCDPYSGWNCYGDEYTDTQAGEPSPPPPSEIRLNSVLVIYLRDGSGYGVNDYWVAGGQLNFVTTYNSEKSVAFENVDWQRTVDDNAARGVYFKLNYSPSRQRYKPSIAPVCLPSSGEKARTAPSSSVAGGAAGSFGAMVSPAGQGSKVTFVQAGSPAARAGISLGDIVLRIDCQTVHNGGDIESAIAANTTGTAWVSYLIKGAWLSEQQIKVRD